MNNNIIHDEKMRIKLEQFGKNVLAPEIKKQKEKLGLTNNYLAILIKSYVKNNKFYYESDKYGELSDICSFVIDMTEGFFNDDFFTQKRLPLINQLSLMLMILDIKNEKTINAIKSFFPIFSIVSDNYNLKQNFFNNILSSVVISKTKEQCLTNSKLVKNMLSLDLNLNIQSRSLIDWLTSIRQGYFYGFTFGEKEETRKNNLLRLSALFYCLELNEEDDTVQFMKKNFEDFSYLSKQKIKNLNSNFVNIREYKEGDGEQVSKLLALLNESSSFSESSFLESSISIGIVAENIDNEIIGFGAFCLRYIPSHGGYTASVEDLIVDPKHRGKRVGLKIINKIISEAKVKGLRAINLTSNNKRKFAQKLYTKRGFKKIDSSIFVMHL